jgi:hypothetical protein
MEIEVSHKKLPIGTLIALVATGLFFTILSSSTIISAVEVSSRSISSGGSIVSMNVEIFSNIDLTQTCSNINWGILTPGETVSQTIYIKNNGNKAITLSMTTENWSPANASTYMSLSWNQESTSLDPGQATPASLTLATAADISSISDFDFNIIIIGIE